MVLRGENDLTRNEATEEQGYPCRLLFECVSLPYADDCLGESDRLSDDGERPCDGKGDDDRHHGLDAVEFEYRPIEHAFASFSHRESAGTAVMPALCPLNDTYIITISYFSGYVLVIL